MRDVVCCEMVEAALPSNPTHPVSQFLPISPLSSDRTDHSMVTLTVLMVLLFTWLHKGQYEVERYEANPVLNSQRPRRASVVMLDLATEVPEISSQ